MGASLLVLVMLVLLPATLSTQCEDKADPMPHPDAVIVVGRVRFTVLTDRVLRIERSSSSSQFEDRPTLAVLNRHLPVPHYTVSQTNESLVIQTDSLTLRYTWHNTSEKFHRDSLSVSGRLHNNNSNNSVWTWRYGDQDPHNLLGTIRTLDLLNVVSLNCTHHDRDAHCEYGLVSRAGYAVVNDTENWCLSSSSGSPLDDVEWWDGPNRDDEDLYLFGHGHDYRAALRDYTLIGGRIPLLPRYALGIWHSRWYDYSPADIEDEVAEYEQRSLPLDVFVLDMNWHTKHNWTGYSWDRRLYQHPADALAFLKHRGLAVTLNLHDANGVAPWEAQYPVLCEFLQCKQGETIPFTVVNETVMLGIDDLVLRPLQQQGVDFWWIDWQQGEAGPGGALGGKMNPTIWTAHVRSTQPMRLREDRRTMVLARWGGLGAHRYPVHFSGDVKNMSWDTLAFQAYFSMTAVNVGAIWSHDTHAPSDDPELYTRFVQWSAFAGITRAHDRGYSAGDCIRRDHEQVCTTVEPWKVPTKFAKANYEALRTRARLLPYIYTAMHRAHETGLQFTAPLYYEWPELDGAYETAALKPDQSSELGSQYLFGSDLWVAPVATPANRANGIVQKRLWIPPGIWVGIVGGRVLRGAEDGSSTVATTVDLNEIPVFARAGSVVPTRPVRAGKTVGLAMKPYAELVWNVYLARGAPTVGFGTVYEDDGRSLGYARGEFATTTAEYRIFPSDSLETDILMVVMSVSTKGQAFDSLPKSRATTFRLVNTLAPNKVTYANGTQIPCSRFGGKDTWSFDSRDSAVTIELSAAPTFQNVSIVVHTRAAPTLDGIGFQIARARAAKASLDEARIAPGSQTGKADSGGALLRVSSMGTSLDYLAGHSLSDFDSAVLEFAKLFAAARQEVSDMIVVKALDATYEERSLLHADEFSAFHMDPEIQYRVMMAKALLDTAAF